MSAADEVDGLGVARPHYGCECGGSAALGLRGRARCLRGAGFPGARAGGRVRQGGCGPRGPGRAGLAGRREGGVAGGEAPSAVSEAVARTQAASSPGRGRHDPRAPPSASRFPARPRFEGGTASGEVAGGRGRACPGDRGSARAWRGGAAPTAACELDPGCGPARPQASRERRLRAGHFSFLGFSSLVRISKIKTRKKKKNPNPMTSSFSEPHFL